MMNLMRIGDGIKIKKIQKNKQRLCLSNQKAKKDYAGICQVQNGIVVNGTLKHPNLKNYRKEKYILVQEEPRNSGTS